MLPDLRGANTSGRDRNIKRSSDVIMVGLWIRPGRTSRISLYAEQKGAHKVAQFSSATRQEKMQEGGRSHSLGGGREMQKSEEVSWINRTTSWMWLSSCC